MACFGISESLSPQAQNGIVAGAGSGLGSVAFPLLVAWYHPFLEEAAPVRSPTLEYDGQVDDRPLRLFMARDCLVLARPR